MVGAASTPATRYPTDCRNRPSRPSPQPRSSVRPPGSGRRSSRVGRLMSACELSRPGVRVNRAHVPASASQPSRILTQKACHIFSQVRQCHLGGSDCCLHLTGILATSTSSLHHDEVKLYY